TDSNTPSLHDALPIFTHSIMMAGVVSANVVLVALANDILHAGARGLGFLEAGWATGAICGGLLASQLPGAKRMPLYVAACAVLRSEEHTSELQSLRHL